jgi:hypothetical protein
VPEEVLDFAAALEAFFVPPFLPPLPPPSPVELLFENLQGGLKEGLQGGGAWWRLRFGVSGEKPPPRDPAPPVFGPQGRSERSAAASGKAVSRGGVKKGAKKVAAGATEIVDDDEGAVREGRSLDLKPSP